MKQSSQGQSEPGESVLLKSCFLCVPSSATFVNVPTVFKVEMELRVGREEKGTDT